MVLGDSPSNMQTKGGTGNNDLWQNWLDRCLWAAESHVRWLSMAYTFVLKWTETEALSMLEKGPAYVLRADNISAHSIWEIISTQSWLGVQ